MVNISAAKEKVSKKEVICSVEYPPGSGCRCGKPSFDGVTARCKKHAGENPEGVRGLHSAFKPLK